MCSRTMGQIITYTWSALNYEWHWDSFSFSLIDIIWYCLVIFLIFYFIFSILSSFNLRFPMMQDDLADESVSAEEMMARFEDGMDHDVFGID